jgi:hypothetical protein
MNIFTFTITVAATNKTLSVFFSFVRSDGCMLENGIGMMLEMDKTRCINLHFSFLVYNTVLSDWLFPNISEGLSFVP